MNEPETDAVPTPTAALAPFDWTAAGHAIVKAGEAVDWDIADPESFVKRVQSIEYGLSAETEFAAIVSWLGRCPLVHRLDQDYFSSSPGSDWSIPDLFCLFEHAGARCAVLIEVKTRKNERLAIPTAELKSMRRYAELHSLPLLYAWKPRRLGFWVLVDPVHFVERDGKSILELEPAMKNNLRSAVVGDFLVIPKAGAGLFFEANIVKKTRTTKSGFEAIAQLQKAEFRDAAGQRTTKIPGAIIALLFASMEVVDTVTEEKLSYAFVTEGHPIHAQQVLRASVAFRNQAKCKSIKWRHVAKDLDAYLSRQELHDAIQSHFGTFVQYQFFQQPQAWPQFLPALWNPLLGERGAPPA